MAKSKESGDCLTAPGSEFDAPGSEKLHLRLSVHPDLNAAVEELLPAVVSKTQFIEELLAQAVRGRSVTADSVIESIRSSPRRRRSTRRRG